MDIPIELYKVFYYVTKCGTISNAARKLFISQPAVSKSIIKLEKITGCTLFVRYSRGVKLTTEGEILFSHIKIAFKHLEQAERTIVNLKNCNNGRVKIGVSNTVCKYYFMPKLQALHKRFSDITVQVINVPSPQSISLLEKGEIDFAIITYSEREMINECDYYELMEINDIFVSNNKDDIALGVNALHSRPIMLLEEGNQSRSYIEKYFSSNELVVTPEIEIGSMDFLVEFACIGIGIACVIQEFVHRELNDFRLYKIPVHPKPSPRKMGVIVQKGVPRTTAANKFIELILSEKE